MLSGSSTGAAGLIDVIEPLSNPPWAAEPQAWRPPRAFLAGPKMPGRPDFFSIGAIACADIFLFLPLSRSHLHLELCPWRAVKLLAMAARPALRKALRSLAIRNLEQQNLYHHHQRHLRIAAARPFSTTLSSPAPNPSWSSSKEVPDYAIPDPSRPTHFGFQTVTEAEKREKVAGVFTSVAESYDRMNDLMSFGWHRVWK